MKKIDIIDWLTSKGFFDWMPDEMFLKMRYRKKFHKALDLENPKTFNEKLQWLKLYDRKPEYTQMVDKYEAKKYVADRIGEEYIIPTLGVWDQFDDIDFNSLPNQFVLKCTHDSGGLVICRDKSKLDKEAARMKIEKSLKTNYYLHGREWPYKNVKPRIIAEQYMEDSATAELRDYKIFTFDGVAKALFIATERASETKETKFDFLDTEFRHLPFTNGHPNADVQPAKPETFEEMLRLAENLSANIPHLCFDFYEVDSKTYFGELTFSHSGEITPIETTELEKVFGDWIKLPETIGGYCLIGDGYVLWAHEKDIYQKSLHAKKDGLTDYKFYCFDGKPEFLYISQGLEDHSTARISFVTLDWQFAPYRRSDYKPFDELPQKPQEFDKMVELARALSNGHPFLRVDLYQIGSKVYFSELTFTPCSGFLPFENPDHDTDIGHMIKISV